MIDAEETKRLKAKNLRFKKPICRDLNLDAIKIVKGGGAE